MHFGAEDLLLLQRTDITSEKLSKIWKNELGILQAPFYDFGPHPLVDNQGYKVAFATLLASTKSGRYDKSHTQWQTIRHIKWAVGTYKTTSAIAWFGFGGWQESSCAKFSEGINLFLVVSTFFAGCKSRMGSKVIKYLALDVKLILEVLSVIDQKIANKLDHEDTTE